MLNNDYFIAFKNNNSIPPKELTLSPKEITFKEKCFYSTLNDKRNDNTLIPRISCYNDINRAIDMSVCNKDELRKTNYYDIYKPVNPDRLNNPDFYSYDYLVNSGNITKKNCCLKECWYVNSPIIVQYVGTVKYNGRNSEWVCKDYDYSDIVLNEKVIEDIFVKTELKYKDVTILFKATENKERIIFPDEDHLGNRLNRKKHKCSLWFQTPECAMLDFIVKELRQNGYLEKEDYVFVNSPEIGQLYINKNLKEEIMRVLKSLIFYVNVINVPKTVLFSKKNELGYGWDIYQYNFSYNHPLEPETIKEVTYPDFYEFIDFVDEARLDKEEKINKKAFDGKRFITHGLIYNKKGEKI